VRVRLAPPTLSGLLTLQVKRTHLLDDDEEDGVASGRHVVHFRRSCRPTQRSPLHQRVYFIWRPDSPLRKSLDEDALLAVLPDLQTCAFHFEQVRDDFVVDLEVACAHHESCVLVGLVLDPSEDFLHRARDDAPMRISTRVFESLHRVRLAGAGLSISENRGVVALKDRTDRRFGCTLVHVFLRRVHVVDLVEGVGVPHGQVRIHLDVSGPLSVVDFTSEVLHDRDRPVFAVDLHHRHEKLPLFFASQGRPQSHHDLKVVDVRRPLTRLEHV